MVSQKWGAEYNFLLSIDSKAESVRPGIIFRSKTSAPLAAFSKVPPIFCPIALPQDRLASNHRGGTQHIYKDGWTITGHFSSHIMILHPSGVKISIFSRPNFSQRVYKFHTDIGSSFQFQFHSVPFRLRNAYRQAHCAYAAMPPSPSPNNRNPPTSTLPSLRKRR